VFNLGSNASRIVTCSTKAQRVAFHRGIPACMWASLTDQDQVALPHCSSPDPLCFRGDLAATLCQDFCRPSLARKLHLFHRVTKFCKKLLLTGFAKNDISTGRHSLVEPEHCTSSSRSASYSSQYSTLFGLLYIFHLKYRQAVFACLYFASFITCL
jgi:hypothetical protein